MTLPFALQKYGLTSSSLIICKEAKRVLPGTRKIGEYISKEVELGELWDATCYQSDRSFTGIPGAGSLVYKKINENQKDFHNAVTSSRTRDADLMFHVKQLLTCNKDTFSSFYVEVLSPGI